MKDKKVVVLRYLELEDLRAKLQALGVKVNQPVDKETLQIEGHFEACNTPELTTTVGKVITVWASAESAELMSGVMPPEVLVDWIEGELEEVQIEDTDPETGKVTTTTAQMPYAWPVYMVEIDGVTFTQAAGRFQV